MQSLHHRVVETGAEAFHVVREVCQDVDEQHDHRTHEEVRDEVAGHVAIHGAHEGIHERTHKRQVAQQPQKNGAEFLLNGVAFRHAGHFPFHLLQLNGHQVKRQQRAEDEED